MKSTAGWLLSLCLLVPVYGQQIEIHSVPTYGSPGLVTGTVTGLNPATHRLAHNIYVEGAGWFTVGGTNIPINNDGSFTINMGTAGIDEYATHYSVTAYPVGASVPQFSSANTLNLGANAVASDYAQRYGTQFDFGGRQWGAKGGPYFAGPGNNLFSDDTNSVWVDQEGMHLTVRNVGGQWRSSEVVLEESLGYGTYMFKTNSRQDILDANVTFGAFTWDVFGDDERIPAWPNREIDFEDSRWGNPFDPTNSQVVIQPWWVDGNVERFTLPDLSGEDATLTRFFTWAPGRVEFYTLLGDHNPSDFPQSAIINHTVLTESFPNNLVPEPGRENFRFNLWLNQGGPAGPNPIEVLITDFAYTGLGDFDFDGTYACADLDALVAEIVSGNDAIEFDLDGNGLVNGADLTEWLSIAGETNLGPGLSYLVGDANLDGAVDGQDFVAWNTHKFTSSGGWCNGDFNTDGVIDGQDFVTWNNNKFSSVGDVVSVPEPAIERWLPLVFLMLGRRVVRARRLNRRRP